MSKGHESDLGAYFEDSIVNLSTVHSSCVKDGSEFKQIVPQKIKDIYKERNCEPECITFSKEEKLNEIEPSKVKNHVSKPILFSERHNSRCSSTVYVQKHITRNGISKNITENCGVNEKSCNDKKLSQPSTILSHANDMQSSVNECKDNTNIIAHFTESSSESIKNNLTISLTESKLMSSIMSSNASSIIPTENRCKLASWGLPINILEKYESKGVTNMFPWQVECLSCEKVIANNRNLVYSAPTSAGKTLVAEILLLKTVLERQKKAIFVLPFVSVVREKMYYFKDLLANSGIKIDGFMGGIAPAGGFTATHVAIATIEKANSLINRLMEEGNLACLGSVIVDELHLIGDQHRGYLLELLLTKLKYMTQREDNINIQLIGMSATLPNLSLLAEWLDAAFYKTEFRPVPLNEQCKIGTNIYDANMHVIRTLTPSLELPTDEDNIFQLCIETITAGHSVLIFCPTKNWCEKLAQQISSTFFKLGCENSTLGEILKQQLDSTLILETLEQLKRSPTGLDNVLKHTISFGVAFHHAGLTMEERDIIEGSFKSGALRVLTATSTLSSGVNLPARRVIIRTPIFGGHFLDTLTYKQMIGRAGRMGQDTAGESILVCKPMQQNAAKSLLSASLEPIQSCLHSSEPLIRALLEAIASNVVITSADLELYALCTLVSFSEKNSMKNPCSGAVKYLIENEFVNSEDVEEGSRWVASHLGKACLAASVHPKDGLILFEELQRARKCLALDTELHIIYLVTPVNAGSQIGTIDWIGFMELWKTMSESERRVGELVGVSERFLMSAVRGIIKSGKSLNIHRRFYTAMALHDLVRETSLDDVCKKYGCCRGLLQGLQQTAATFAGMVTQFCKQLGWDCMELLIVQFQTRLQFGVRRELLDLLRLPMLDGIRARSLYKQGITCVADLAIANELDVEQALYKALPFESEKDRELNGLNSDNKGKMRSVFISGRDGVTPHEAAVMLIEEARVFLQAELKLQNIPWEQKDSSSLRDASNKYSQSSKGPEITTIGTFSDGRININKKNEHTNQSELDKCEEFVREKRSNYERSLSMKTQTKSQNIDMEKNTVISQKIAESIENISSEKSADAPECQRGNQLCLQSSLDKVPSLLNSLSEEFKDHVSVAKDLQTNEESMNSLLDIAVGKDPTSSEKQHDSILSNMFENTIDKVSMSNNIEVEYSKNGEKSNSNIFDTEVFDDDIAFSKIAQENSIKLQLLTSTKGDVNPLSPNLFDDSFPLDTQMCNALEENIIDSLHTSELEKALASDVTPSLINDSNKTSEVNAQITTVKSCKVNGQKKQYFPVSSVVRDTTTNNKTTFLSWKDDSWNQSNGVIKKLCRLDKEKLKDNINVRPTLKRNDNMQTTSISNTVQKRNIRTRSKTVNKEKENINTISLKQKSRKVPLHGSPVANLIIYNSGRRPSIDSNKSDSDDVVISSQVMSSPLLSINRTTSSKQGVEGSKNRPLNCVGQQEVSKTATSQAIPQQKLLTKKLGLKDILPRNTALRFNPSTSSAFDSDDDIPAKKAKLFETPLLEPNKDQLNLKMTDSDSCKNKIRTDAGGSRNDMKVSAKWNGVNIIKLANDKKAFSAFKRDVMKKTRVALALSCEAYVNESAVNGIGTKIIRSSTNQKRKRVRKSTDAFVHDDKRICGVMISWESNVAYYISFCATEDAKVSTKDQVDILKRLLSKTSLYVSCFATKDVYKILYQCCKIYPDCRFLDPKTAHWLLSGDINEKNFNEMVSQYFPRGIVIIKQIENHCSTTGPGLCINSSLSGETRAAIEVCLTWDIQNILSFKLEEQSLMLKRVFEEVEMRTILVLARMELSGLGVCQKSLQELSSTIQEEMSLLEERAHALAGRKFNLSSPKDVAEILGLNRRKKICTNKAILEQCVNPISDLVMLWRKLNSTQSKIVYPLLSSIQHGSRVHGNCVTCTQTGRISMYEPNLQNVPRDFNSASEDLIISVRTAFVPATNNIMLSADYCQLELRILAHFSKDTVLCNVMQKEGDVFKSIAAKWNSVSEDQVDDTMRQRTKQLCYGMIYGMGVKTLAETLSVTETEAKEFLETFMNTYSGVRQWLNDVLVEARKNGYITTLLGRRRMLPGLFSKNPAEKSQSERQAINTKVQGSAADIAKKAMIVIDDRLQEEFPDAPTVLYFNNDKRIPTRNSKDTNLCGGFLVLQLHDELLYEVHLSDLNQVATIVKQSMENVCEIGVPLPVKIKVGPSWGNLSEWQMTNLSS